MSLLTKLWQHKVATAPDSKKTRSITASRIWLYLTVPLALAAGVLALLFVSKSRQNTELTNELVLVSREAIFQAQQLDEVFKESYRTGLFQNETSRPLLEAWIRYDREFLRESEGNESLSAERATAHCRLANAFLLQQRLPEAANEFVQSLLLLEGLSADYPSTLAYQKEIAEISTELGKVYAALNRYPDAVASLKRAHASLNQLTNYLQESDFQIRLAAIYQGMTDVEQQRGNLNEAIGYLSLVAELRTKVSQTLPQDIFQAYSAGQTYLNLLELRQKAGDQGELRKVQQQAKQFLSSSLQRWPGNQVLQNMQTQIDKITANDA